MRHMALGTTLEQPVPRRMRDDRGSPAASEQCPFSARLPDSISDDFIERWRRGKAREHWEYLYEACAPRTSNGFVGCSFVHVASV